MGGAAMDASRPALFQRLDNLPQVFGMLIQFLDHIHIDKLLPFGFEFLKQHRFQHLL